MRKIAIVLIIALASLIPVSPAPATPPNHIETFTEPFEFITKCQGFRITTTGTFEITLTEFFDQDGNLIRVMQQATYEDVITLSKGDAVFTERGHQTLEFTEESFTVSGQAFTITGDAFKIYDVGRIIFDQSGEVVFASNQHPLVGEGLDGVDAALCAALGEAAGLT